MTTAKYDNIIDALHISELLPEEQDEIIADLNELVFEGVLIRALEQMDTQTRAEFNELLDSDPDEEKLEDFLKENVPTFDESIADTIAEISSDILAVTN
jgi:hypothetical protein